MMTPARALFLRTIGDARIRMLAFGLLFAIMPLVQVIGYRTSYPTLADRLKFAGAFSQNKALRLFYGMPHDLTSVGGYASWRVAGILALFAAFFGALAAVRAFRGEEESGRYELVAVGALSRGTAFFARAAAMGVVVSSLVVATTVGLVASRLPLSDSLYLALETTAPAAVYASVGIVACQWLPTSRGALQLTLAVLAVDFAIRVIADTVGLTALHWVTPLGWTEEVRAFAGARPLVLLLPAAATAAGLLAGFALEARRDIGSSLLTPDDTVPHPRAWLLSSPLLLSLRAQLTSLAIWAAGVTSFAFVVGTISKSVAPGLSKTLQEQLQKLGVDIASPSGYIGLTFLFFIFAISLFCCSQVAAIRQDESEGRLETLFALPMGRTRWLAERIALAAGAAALMSLLTALAAAIGATTVDADISFVKLLGAGANALPATYLFLGIGTLLFALLPREGVGIAYAVVVVAFVWQLVGALLSLPVWLLDLSPFHQVALVPAVRFQPWPPAIMLGVGAVSALLALLRFRARDLTGA